MVLHKIVNGIRVDCLPEEEAKILAEWEQNAIKQKEEKEKKEKEKSDYKKALNNLLSAVSEEDKEVIMKVLGKHRG